jgi:hypothetical protein
VTAVALVTLLVGGGPARASDDDEVERRGSCSRGAEWKIKAKPDDGRIEVEGEVESDTRGTWKWRLFHNDSLSAHGTGRTGGSDDSFEVSREMTDLAGVDRFSFRARNTRTGEWCRGPVSL